MCFLWPGREYAPAHVNILERMVARHLPEPYRFVCVTDGFDATQFSPKVDVVPTPPAARALGALTTPEGEDFPSCYRRLWTLSREAAELGDERLVLDVDCLIRLRLVPLFQHAPAAPFVAWQPEGKWSRALAEAGLRMVGGGTYLVRGAACDEVWRRFLEDPHGEIQAAQAAGCRGSDQGILTHRLGPRCAFWPPAIGIYGNAKLHEQIDRLTRRRALRRGRHPVRHLPDDARIVHFNGNRKPWHMLHVSWVREHWH